MKKINLRLLYDYVLPNMIMPNALITEFAMVNFLQSKYLLNEGGRSQLEQGKFLEYKDHTLAALLFNEQLGLFPNSLTNTHLKSPCYFNFLHCEEQSVYIGKSDHTKYIYPIKCTPHFDKFIGGSKLNSTYFWKNISLEVITDAREGRAIILIDYAQENFIEKFEYNALHEALRYSNIPKENVILALNSFNAQQVYESWYPEQERYLQVRNWPFVISNTSHHYDNNKIQSVDPIHFKKSKNVLRKYHFLFKIRRPRNHRLLLLARLANDGILVNGDWSCLNKINFDENNLKLIINSNDFEFNSENIKKVFDSTPKSLESESYSNYHNVSAWTDINAEAYKNSYFYICTESYVHGEHKSLTEKIFKPIVNYQPFLFVAYPGALKMLQDLGFKTFEGFIDESYDTEPDLNKRINMVYCEIKKLCKMSKQELHNWYWSMEEILEHNRNHFLNIWKDESISLGFIEELYERTK